MPIQEKCQILAHKEVGPKIYKLTLASSYISSHAQPGQFVNLRCSENLDPLLRRPLSIYQASQEHKIFELLYKVIGKGTELLSKHSIGEKLDIFGPLGEGFKINPQKKIFILVGGGMGVAPLLFLAQKLKSQGENALYILVGAKSRDFVIEEEDFRKITDQVLVSTEDGSYGKKGLISDVLQEVLENTLSLTSYPLCTIYACGPKEMLRAIAEISFQKKIECQISLEERMACGIGACLGCAAKTTLGYKMVCKDGPVFDVKEIIWQT